MPRAFRARGIFLARTFAGPAQGKLLQAVLRGPARNAPGCDFLPVCLGNKKEAQEALGSLNPLTKQAKLLALLCFRFGRLTAPLTALFAKSPLTSTPPRFPASVARSPSATV